ncbi:MAG: aminopeptidase P family protein [Gammaproteobacteria bacterium]|nr:aminopeptidase P family protein [Gammaproteobacteria bacterium]
MNYRLVLAFTLIIVAGNAIGDAKVLPLQERAAVIDRWLSTRVQTVLPGLMERVDIDMWVIISREYNEDPVIRTMIPATWHSARRRTILLIFNPGGGQPLETLAVARYAVGDMFEKAWDKELHGDQWARLAEIIKERNPRRIGLNYSETFALADGISQTEYRLFHAALDPALHDRVVSAEKLAIGWLETRTADEMVTYQNIVRIAHEILAEGMSEKVVQPGVTTTGDVMWWYRDRIRELKLTTWFHPSVSVDRAAQPEVNMKAAISARHDDEIIMPGDLLHVDFGISYLRLNTDTQQHAYVLKPGETEAPQDLRAALVRGNRLQDILTDQFVAGRTGNEILASALAVAKDEGIVASIYTHPIGYHGHAAGPTIGLWDQQDGVPGRGDYPLFPNTAHSIELYAETDVESWGKAVRISLEEDAFFDGEKTHYIDGRQKEFLLIPRVAPVQ